MVMGRPVKDLISKIGHDGSEIRWPDLPEPKCRRAFHPQEVLFAARKLGFHFVIWEINLGITPDGKHFHSWSDYIHVRRIMSESKGVVFGRGQRVNHCWAWDGKNFIDPSDISNQVKDMTHYAELIGNQN